MAKRKLSAKTSAAVRLDLKRLITADSKTSKILSTIAKKHKIGIETVRYYLKTLDHSPRKRGRRPASRDFVIPDLVHNYSEADLRKIITARRLSIKFKAILEKKKALERRISQTESKIRELEKKINRLVR